MCELSTGTRIDTSALSVFGRARRVITCGSNNRTRPGPS
jgi:hypothetical protein